MLWSSLPPILRQSRVYTTFSFVSHSSLGASDIFATKVNFIFSSLRRVFAGDVPASFGSSTGITELHILFPPLFMSIRIVLNFWLFLNSPQHRMHCATLFCFVYFLYFICNSYTLDLLDIAGWFLCDELFPFLRKIFFYPIFVLGDFLFNGKLSVQLGRVEEYARK